MEEVTAAGRLPVATGSAESEDEEGTPSGVGERAAEPAVGEPAAHTGGTPPGVGRICSHWP